MEKYDYREAIESEMIDFLNWESEYGELGPYDSPEEMYDNLYERMLDCDSITGNESGQYCSSEWEAEECLCHNLDLLKDALDCYGYSTDYVIKGLEKGARWCDVIVRCYLVGEVLSEVLADGWYERCVIDEPIDGNDEDDDAFWVEDLSTLFE